MLLFWYLCSTVAAGGAGNVTTNAQGYASLWVSEPDGRGSWTIIYSATFTMILCAWSALHANIPPKGEDRKRLADSTVRVLGSLLMPELILVNATGQWRLTRKFRAQLNDIAARRPQKSSTPRPSNAGQPPLRFSNRYAWFATMGGFVVDISSMHNELEQATLTPSGLLFLAEHGHFCQISDEEINDKSKADYLAKGLVFFQVVWFSCQSIQRLVAGLPLSILEIHTLINVVAALVTYSIWFGKPLNIYTPKLETGEDLDELLAVLLFQHCIPNYPHQCLIRQSALDAQCCESESELWCWTASQEMVLVERLDLTDYYLPPLSVQHNLRIVPCRTRRDPRKEYPELRGVPEALSEASFVRTLPGGPQSLPQPLTPEPARTAKDDDPPLQFEVALTAKDETRLELVRRYIVIHHGDGSNPTMIGQQNVIWRRMHDWGGIQFKTQPSRTGTGIAPETRTQAHSTPPLSNPRSTATRAGDSTIDIEMQPTNTGAAAPSNMNPPSRAPTETHGCPGHGNSTHIAVDELPCFPHTLAAGLVLASKDWTSSTNNKSANTLFVLDDGNNDLSVSQALVAAAFGVVMCASGALHLIPCLTGSSFPTRAEELLWKFACYIILSPLGSAGIMYVLFFLVYMHAVLWKGEQASLSEYIQKAHANRQGWWRRGPVSLSIFLKTFLAVYIFAWFGARGVLLVESFISLRKEKGEMFMTPDWNWLDSIPHI